MKQLKHLLTLLLVLGMLLPAFPAGIITAAADGTAVKPVLTVDNLNAVPGSEVSVAVTIRNNPGILGMTLSLTYDETVAELTSVQKGDALGYMTFTTPRNLHSGMQLPWDAEDVDPDALQDGTVVILTFVIVEDAPVGQTMDITLSYADGAIIDGDVRPLDVTIRQGSVTIIDFEYGDLNNDHLVNTTDVVLLRRFIAGGYGVTINEAAADVYLDKNLNTTDVVLIRRYIAGGYGIDVLPVANEEKETETEFEPTITNYHTIVYRNIKTAEYPSLTSYAENTGLLDLPVLNVSGYRFVGWYTASEGGQLVDYIPAGATTDYVLFAHWEVETYTITYRDAPVHDNPEVYTIESEFTLNVPRWSGLSFMYWTDENGDKCEGIEKGTTGNVVLTANWKRLQNIATPSIKENDMLVIYNEDTEQYHFVYELGTIEHVVLENITLGSTNLKYNSNVVDLSFELSNTVNIEDSVADSIAKEISQSISQSSEWAQASEWAKRQSVSVNMEENYTLSAELGVEGVAAVKEALEISMGISATDEDSWGKSVSNGGSQTSGSETSQSVSSTVSYKKALTNTITTCITISKDMPEGYYSYVHAGNIRVYAVVTYDSTTKDYHLDTYSILDNMHEMMLYYRDVNELNRTVYEVLAFDVDTEAIDAYLSESLYYVEYDANGGEGTMPVSVFSYDKTQVLYPNQFAKTGYTFIGWQIETEDGFVQFQDSQQVTGLGANGDVITLTAVWLPNVYSIQYDANEPANAYTPISGSMNGMDTLYYDEPAVLRKNQFHLTGWTFVGWALTPDGPVCYRNGTEVCNLTTEMCGIVTLYAIWEQNVYTIEYVYQYMIDDSFNVGSSVVHSCNCKYGDTIVLPSCDFRTGWTCDGWQNVPNNNVMPDGNITITATWYLVTSCDAQWGTVNDKISDDIMLWYTIRLDGVFDMEYVKKYHMTFVIDLSFHIKEKDDGNQVFGISTTQPEPGGDFDGFSGTWLYQDYEISTSGERDYAVKHFEVSSDSLNSSNRLYFCFGCHGKFDDDWYLTNLQTRISLTTVNILLGSPQ